MNTYYVLPAGTSATNPPSADVTRAQALTASLIVGDPSGLVTDYPSVVVMSPALATVVIADDTGQATLAQVQTAQTNATNAETTKADKITAANTALQSVVAQLAPGLAQAQTDLTTLSASTDPLAPILARTVQGVITLAQAVSDALVYLEIIS